MIRKPVPKTRVILGSLKREFGLTVKKLSSMLGRPPQWLQHKLATQSGEDLPWSHYEALLRLLEGLRRARAAARAARSISS